MRLPVDIERFRVKPGKKVRLSDWPARADAGLSKPDAAKQFSKLLERLRARQELLYADGRRAVLAIIQGMDAAGKDSTIRRVFGALNPQSCQVTAFKAPSATELAHDYLWRVHAATPWRGSVGVFNRSHYEDVLVVRVKGLAPKSVWARRYDHINAFEQMLTDEGVHVVKFFLHISKDYQKRQLQERLDDPRKHWKFAPEDVAERARWDDYQAAYEAALGRCSTAACPWYVVPNERRWFGALTVASVLAHTLDKLPLEMPKPKVDLSQFKLTD